MSENKDVDYVKQLIDHLESDKRSVLLYVLFDLGLLAITLNILFGSTQLALSCIVKGIFSLSIISIGLSALFFFDYFRVIHVERLNLTKFFKNQTPDEAKILYDKFVTVGIYRTTGWPFTWGQRMLLLGVILYLITLLSKLWCL